jgi:hypothetical protein
VFAQEATALGDPWIATLRHQRTIALGRKVHGPEFIDRKEPSILPHPCLPENHRTMGFHEDGKRTQKQEGPAQQKS